MKSLPHYWYSQNIIAWLLLPLSWLFCMLAWLRRALYHYRLLKPAHFPVPVIVVGNISVGGTGKTPLLIALCERLLEQGLAVGIVSRGYGRQGKGVHSVTREDTPASVGDEPVVIRRRTGVSVVVGADRAAAVSHLLDMQTCDVVLSDDGMQHYRLHRDYEIAVVDAARGLGNGFCLPAGPLRERAGRLDTVNVVVFNDATCADTESRYCFRLELSDAVNLVTGEKRALESFGNQRIHAVAGIGHPERFFQQLERAGLSIERHAFPDHHEFIRQDVDFADTAAVLMTEKDAVKCSDFAHDGLWYVAASAVLCDRLAAKLVADIDALRSRSGNE